jgi:MFS family permease
VRELLRDRRFATFWGGQAVSLIGSGMAPVALAALVLTYYGAVGLGAAMASTSVAFGVALLGGGVIADRYSRTSVMAVADVMRCGGALANLFLLGRVPLAVVCVFAGLVGLGEALFRPAYRAAFAQLLGPDLLRRATVWQAMVGRGALAVGAALAGLLIATVGPRVAFGVDAATFLVSIATLLAIRLPRAPRDLDAIPPGLRGAFRDAADGLRAVWRVPWAAVVMAQGTVQVVAGFSVVFVLVPLIATDRYGPAAFGILAALAGVGSMLGNLLSLRLRTRREGLTAMHGVAAFGGVCLCLAVPVPFWVFGAAELLGWIGIGIFSALWFPALQREFPDEVQGRVFSLEQLATFALEPVGMAVAPFVAAAVGVAAVGLGAAATIVLSSYAVLVVHRPVRPTEAEPVATAAA